MKKKKKVFALLISIITFILGVNFVNAEGEQGKINLEKTATKVNLDDRIATVNLQVTANSFNSSDKIDVVLVIDRSSSMNGNPMYYAKEAAKDLLDTLLTEENKNSVRAAIVTYGSDLLSGYTSSSFTNDKSTLKSVIESIPNNAFNQGTNIHAGLIKANDLLEDSEENTEKVVILLSDGDPTFYVGSNGRCGNGENNSSDSDYGCRVTINEESYNTPQSVTSAYANELKDENDIIIHTIAYGTSSTFLNNISSDPDSVYSHSASDYDDLTEVFGNIVQQLTLVASDAEVTDIIPEGFQIVIPDDATVVENSNGTKTITWDNFTAIENVDGTKTITWDNATAVENSDGTTTITWKIGDIKSTDTNTLTYPVEAKDGYYGSMYTNASATLNATKADGNPAYDTTDISIDFAKPVVSIPPVTEDDNYTVDDEYDVRQGESLIITNPDLGILANDDLITKVVDAGATVTDRIVLVYDETTTGTASDIVLNVSDDGTFDGTFTYTPSQAVGTGNVTYKYYVETTVTLDGVSTIVKSNYSIITLKIVENPTTYIVNYLEKDTNNILNPQKTADAKVYEVITSSEEVIEIDGYEFDSLNPEELTITTGENVINIYYTKRTDLSYVVNYLEKDTNEVLSEQKVENNRTYNEVITSSEEVIEIDGYEFDSLNPEELTITTGENVINIYYTKLIGKVIAIYVDIEGNTLAEPVETEGMVTTDYKTSAKEIDDYELIRVEGQENGKYTEETITVKYIYEFFGGAGGGEEDPEVPEVPEIPEVPQTGIDFNITQYVLVINSVIVAIITLIIRKKYTI